MSRPRMTVETRGSAKGRSRTRTAPSGALPEARYRVRVLVESAGVIFVAII